jgi:hypothetical protein
LASAVPQGDELIESATLEVDCLPKVNGGIVIRDSAEARVHGLRLVLDELAKLAA